MKITFLGTSHGDPETGRYNTSLLLEAAGAGYLLDCGSPATASLVRLNFDFSALRGVFLTHMHLDHCCDLPNLLKHLVKRGIPAHAYLPDPDAAAPVDAFLRMGYTIPSGAAPAYHTIRAGRFFADENVVMTAVPTDHGRGRFPSFAFSIEASGKKILYTGDLSASLDDFPVQAAEEADLVICELTHALPEVMENKLRPLALRRVVFTHIGPRYEKAGVLTLPQGLPFAVSAASDGDALSLE
ncbi:MAG: ribonuclease Z [Lentisphaeria bacterium]|nr:ribonuclease Z [Lentisphaeria bacterium]